MLCEKCKIREATIQYTEIVNGVKREHSFCAQCAQETNLGQISALFEGEFPFSRILSALLGEDGQVEDGDYARISCPRCGTSYQEFVKNSRFGCPDCYELFDILIRDSIKQLQGSEQHKGKHPKYGLKILPASLTRELPGIMKQSEEEKTIPRDRGDVQAVQNESSEKQLHEVTETDGQLNDGVSLSAVPDRANENGLGASTLSKQDRKQGELRELRKKLSHSVAEEDYAAAAKYRDMIRALQKEGTDA